MAPRTHTRTSIRSRREEKTSFAWHVLRGVFWIAILALVLGLVWYITHLAFFTITEVTISGGETISHEEVRQQIEMELQGAYFLLVPKHFTYVYPDERIKEVLEKNPRLYNVTSTRTSRTAIAVTFDEYLPHALWCASDESLPCYFMTSTGYAFAEAPRLEGGSLVRHVHESSKELTTGQAVDGEKLTRLETFILQLETAFGFRVSTVFYKVDGDIELSVNGGGKIFITGEKDLTRAFENIRAVLTSEGFSHIEPGNFQYIDARFDNKVFVNEEIPVEVSTTTEDGTELPE